MKERVQEKVQKAAYRGHPLPQAQKTLGADHLQEQSEHPDAPGSGGRQQGGKVTDHIRMGNSLLQDSFAWTLQGT